MGEQFFVTPEFGKGSEVLGYHRINGDEMELTAKASDSGGIDWTVKFNRVK